MTSFRVDSSLRKRVKSNFLLPRKENEPTNLFSASFITDGRSQVYFLPFTSGAIMAANKDAKAGLFKDHSVMVIRVPHSPAAYMSSSVFAILSVHVTTIPIRPLPKLFQFVKLQQQQKINEKIK